MSYSCSRSESAARIEWRATLLLGLCGALLGPAAHADRLVTKDARVLEVKKARPEGDFYRLSFEAGEMLCPKSEIGSVEIEGDMSDYVPVNDDERQKLEDGYVRYRDRWMTKQAYLAEQAKQAAASRKRTEELALHSDFANAWTKETSHFVFITDTSPELLEYYSDLIEAYYKLMDDRIGISPSPQLKRTKMTINIYKSREEFHKLNAAGVGGGVAGYFSGGDKTLNFYHDYAEPAISNWVALHECTHLLTYLIDPQYIPQIWVNEGVADFFGSAEIRIDAKGKPTIIPGAVQTDRVLTVQNAIKDGKDIKLEQLFKIDRSNFQAFEYAHAWAFVYFLNNSSEAYRKGFDKWFKDLYTLSKTIKSESAQHWDKSGVGFRVAPEEIRRALLERIKVKDVDQLEKEWKTFIANVPIDGPAARFKRGYMAVAYGDGDMDLALEDLNAAIEGGITDARAYATRGRLFEMRGRDAEALADFRKAVELSPLDANFRFGLAVAISDAPFFNFSGSGFKIVSSQTKKWKPDGEEAELKEARTNFGFAAELDPQNSYYRDCVEQFDKALAR